MKRLLARVVVNIPTAISAEMTSAIHALSELRWCSYHFSLDNLGAETQRSATPG